MIHDIPTNILRIIDGMSMSVDTTKMRLACLLEAYEPKYQGAIVRTLHELDYRGTAIINLFDTIEQSELDLHKVIALLTKTKTGITIDATN